MDTGPIDIDCNDPGAMPTCSCTEQKGLANRKCGQTHAAVHGASRSPAQACVSQSCSPPEQRGASCSREHVGVSNRHGPTWVYLETSWYMRRVLWQSKSALASATRCISLHAGCPLAATASSRPSLENLKNLAYEENALCDGLATAALPRLEHDGVPIVHHAMLSAPRLATGHRFPMQVFQTLHDYLLEDGVICARQVCASVALFPVELPVHL